MSPRELLPCPATTGLGSRIVLEGDSGSGKSVLCSWLAYTWATQPNYFLSHYQHVIYLNMAILSGNLETAVYKSLFPDNFKISINDFWQMLERKPEGVLLLIDEYDHDSDMDISDILNGKRLKGCTVLLTSRPNAIPQNVFVPDTKWFNLGFNDANIKRCFKNCVSMSDFEHEEFEKLYHLAGRETWPLRPHLSNPMLAILAFGVYSILRKGTLLREMKTTCDLLEKYGVAMATLYCRKQKIDVIGFEFPDEVLRAIEQLDMFAFRCSMANTKCFSEADVQRETNEPIVLRFGAFKTFPNGSKMKFTCGISQDFLAARYLADLAYEDIEATVKKCKMVKLPKYSQVEYA